MSETVIERLNAALRGRYRIERELGVGGMAMVYLADDLKHERKVALKVLKPELAAVVGADRFLAEIRTTANLQHPHILPLHDSGEAGGFLFYVMPYVDGETLRDRLKRDHQLPIDEAVRIATDVAEALQAAHEHGVVHRDVKPANILLSRGRPLVADFGIALAVTTGGGVRLTETGLSLGTPQYMSPEQATGDQGVGPATDTYALACVLFEMLVGEPPFTGSTPQAILGKILSGTAGPITEYRKSVPPNVEAAVRCGLERIPADRFASAEAFRHALSNPGFRFGTAGSDPENALPAWQWRAGVAALLSLAVGIGVGDWLAGPDRAQQPQIRYRLGFEEGQEPVRSDGRSIAVSPDGTRIVYVGPPLDDPQLWIRDRNQLRSEPVPGTRGATQPFVSPDGTSIGFLTPDGALKVVSMEGGEDPLTLVESGVLAYGAAWGDDGYVYFDLIDRVGLTRVASSGGTAPEAVYAAQLGADVRGHGWPDPLPGGRGLIYTVVRNHEDDLIVALDIAAGEYRVLVEGLLGQYAESGHLVYVERDGSLLAAPFDVDRLEITGPSVLLDELGEGFTADLALSANGRLVYAARPDPIFEVVWVDRAGVETPLDPASPLRGVRFLALSPDGARLAVSTWPAPPRDDGQVWIKDLPNGAYQRLTFDGDVNFRPMWTADGGSLTFVSDRLENRDVWIKPIDGSGDARLLLDEEAVIDEAVLSADGQWLLYRRGMQDGERDIYAFRPGVDSVGRPLINTPFDETSPALSPDGRWLAYVALVDDQANVFIRPFPDASTQRRVSTNGGIDPVWAQGGRELFYVDSRDSMVSRRIAPGTQLQLEDATTLFSTLPYRTDFFHQSFDVSRDGQRFVMVRIDAADRATEDLVVVENWFEELKRMVPE